MAKASKGPIGFNIKRTFQVKSGAVTRGYAVKYYAEDQVVVAGAGEACLGVLEETTAQDSYGAVVTFGETIAICASTVVQGDWVKADSAGKLVPSAGEDTQNVGRAMSGATTDGDEFVLFVNPIKKRS